ncbi:MAG: Uma2 family endonuclease [Acidimicrobiales bacterium]
MVTPAPSLGHQRASGVLYAQLFEAETAQTMVVAAPCDWRLLDGGSVQPDLMVISRGNFEPGGPLAATATPLLVVEVLSASNADHDLAVKRHLYESLQVPAYWIVDATVPSITVLRLSDRGYVVDAEVTGDDALVTDWPFPVRVVPCRLTA